MKNGPVAVARKFDLVSVALGIAAALAGLVIMRLIGYLTGDPLAPFSEWVGGVVGAALAASASARSRGRLHPSSEN